MNPSFIPPICSLYHSTNFFTRSVFATCSGFISWWKINQTGWELRKSFWGSFSSDASIQKAYCTAKRFFSFKYFLNIAQLCSRVFCPTDHNEFMLGYRPWMGWYFGLKRARTWEQVRALVERARRVTTSVIHCASFSLDRSALSRSWKSWFIFV